MRGQSEGGLGHNGRLTTVVSDLLRSKIALSSLMLAVSMLAVSMLAVWPSRADDFPSKPLRFLQGFAAGGNADVISRVLADELAKSLGKPVIAEARPGAGGNAASEQVVRAAPDGHTLVLLTTAHVISPNLLKSVPFDPVKDFSFITTVSEFPFIIVTNANGPYKTIAQLVETARAKPGSLTYGSAGVGTGQHMCGELFSATIGAKIVHLPFRGDADSVTALLSNSVDYIIAPATAVLGNIEAGTFRALAISGLRRLPQLQSVPTVAETIAPGFEMMAFVGVATSAGVPQPIIERLNKDLHAAIAQPAVDKRLRDLGGFPAPGTPDEMTQRVATQLKRWAGVIDAAGIQRQ